MYDINALTSLSVADESIVGLVGMDQTNNPEYETLPASLLESRSSFKLQEQHSLLTVKNIDQCWDNTDHFYYTAYDEGSPGTIYYLGDKVSYGGSNYEYINATPSVGEVPPNSTYWQLETPFSQYLLKRQKQAIVRVLSDCFNPKKTKQLVKTIFKDVSLFTGVGRVSDKVINSGKFVGFQLSLANSRGLISVISKIGTQLSQSVTFNIYIYHSSQVDPIATVEVAHGTANNFQWTASGQELRFFSDAYDAGGTFYIGYFQSDLGTSQAIRKDYDWTRRPCSSGCNQTNLELYDNWSKFIAISPFSVSSGHLNGTNLFDQDYIAYEYDNNFGLNLNLSVRCDLTEFIKENELLLAESVALKWALIELNDIAYTTRENGVSEKTKQLALMEMDTKKGDSLINQYTVAIEAMSFDFSTLDKSCMPCNNRFGVQWGGM